MKVSEETLMAYVDGELDAAGVASVEQALREDSALASSVAAQRALRERLRQAYAPVLDEPVPERLLAAARGARDAGGPPGVVPLRAARDARDAEVARRRPWRWREYTALAASLAVGVLLAPWLRPDSPPPMLRMSGDGLVAGAGLEQALDARLSADTGGPVAIGLSFRAQDGSYCRTFVLEPRALAGLACREGDGWHVTALGESEPAAGDLRLAWSPLPPAVLAEVDARLAGEVLDAAGERAARDAGWR